MVQNATLVSLTEAMEDLTICVALAFVVFLSTAGHG